MIIIIFFSVRELTDSRRLTLAFPIVFDCRTTRKCARNNTSFTIRKNNRSVFVFTDDSLRVGTVEVVQRCVNQSDLWFGNPQVSLSTNVTICVDVPSLLLFDVRKSVWELWEKFKLFVFFNDYFLTFPCRSCKCWLLVSLPLVLFGSIRSMSMVMSIQ